MSPFELLKRRLKGVYHLAVCILREALEDLRLAPLDSAEFGVEMWQCGEAPVLPAQALLLLWKWAKRSRKASLCALLKP